MCEALHLFKMEYLLILKAREATLKGTFWLKKIDISNKIFYKKKKIKF